MSPTAAALARKPATTVTATNPPRPEDIKDSPEYKKKHAMLAGPILQMDYENAQAYGMPESLFTSLKDIFEAIVANPSHIGIVSPQKFLDILKRENEMFRGSMHQDAHEFLNLLLNEVVADVEKNTKRIEQGKIASPDLSSAVGFRADSRVSGPTNSSTGTSTPTKTAWVHDLFEGTLTSETRCLTCENVSQRDEIFLDLSVDLDEHSSVTSCLRKFSEEEMLCERNKFHCDNCGGLQEAEKRMKIKRLPRVLALHLKRFKYTEDLQRLQKLFHRVVYPYYLRLFNTTDDAEDPDRLYELYAVVVHIGGGPYHGHYVSIIKTQDRGWLLFDDEMVEPVDKNYVQNFFGDRPGLACAYVLFYQETTLEAVQKEQEAENRSAAAAATSIPKEPVGPLSKLNGIVPNGKVHPAKPTPMVNEEVEPAVSLDHVVSAPPTATAETGALPSLEVSEQPPESKTKRDRAKEEKEQKATEKQRARDLEAKRKEYEKQQREYARAAIVASKQTKAEEESRPDLGFSSEPTKKENGVIPLPSSVMHNSLSRFKQGSKSINKKFWSSKEKEEAPVPSSEKLTSAFIPPEAIEQRKLENTAAAMEKIEKPKSHRFSLKKKSSALFL
jgi:ubiquitin carboxyl-terminal hydrolase 9/13